MVPRYEPPPLQKIVQAPMVMQWRHCRYCIIAAASTDWVHPAADSVEWRDMEVKRKCRVKTTSESAGTTLPPTALHTLQHPTLSLSLSLCVCVCVCVCLSVCLSLSLRNAVAGRRSTGLVGLGIVI